ncbi:hypothetical protein MPL1032_160216 [Mesorhizobium plurifarium]|uniref:Uncharacterized protein n=1 Tax=Mesorhizobium plurifarium TaxID=69974 RepID=A0A0K2VTT3_MESPL|nr:hypothetical protein MPL1032_160216 [Mesorhizobium plurifarium]
MIHRNAGQGGNRLGPNAIKLQSVEQGKTASLALKLGKLVANVGQRWVGQASTTQSTAARAFAG